MMPRPGDIVRVGAGCGVPHCFRPIDFRLIRVQPGSTWEGMAFLDGYELDRRGAAVERRTVYVIVAGLRLVTPAALPVPAVAQRRRPTNAGPVRVPRPRTTPEAVTPSGGIR